MSKNGGCFACVSLQWESRSSQPAFQLRTRIGLKAPVSNLRLERSSSRWSHLQRVCSRAPGSGSTRHSTRYGCRSVPVLVLWFEEVPAEEYTSRRFPIKSVDVLRVDSSAPPSHLAPATARTLPLEIPSTAFILPFEQPCSEQTNSEAKLSAEVPQIGLWNSALVYAGKGTTSNKPVSNCSSKGKRQTLWKSPLQPVYRTKRIITRYSTFFRNRYKRSMKTTARCLGN